MVGARWRRRGAGAVGLLMVATSAVVVTQLVSATPLAPSTFDGADGNLLLSDTEIPGGSGTDALDWENAPNLQAQRETNATPQEDNSFGNGTKEDSPVPSVIDGSIPNNKSDLTRFYVANNKAGSKEFIYLAWERANTLGTANMDFELNQNKCDPLDVTNSVCSSNGVTPTRTAGDVLITYDFAGGGKRVELSLHKWLTAAPASDCFASNSVPCWGLRAADDNDGADDGRLDLDAAGYADGAVNDGFSVEDPITVGGQTGGSILDKRFGEAQINATDAGILPATSTTCTGFGSAYLKSRSSDSFTSAVKDFVAPKPVNITNCGSIKVVKVGDTGPLAGAGFTLYNDNAPQYGSGGAGDTWGNPAAPTSREDTASSVSPNTCTTALATENNVSVATCTFNNVPYGKYWVVETTVPSGYKGAVPQPATVSAGVNGNPTLTFTNARKQATIKVQKRDDSTPPATLDGVWFDFYKDENTSGVFDETTVVASCETATNLTQTGDCTQSGLLVDTYYWVVERSAPSGYVADITAPTVSCTVGGVQKACQRLQVAAGSSTNSDPATVTITFVNKRTFKVLVFVCQESTGELVAAEVVLGGAGSTTLPALTGTANSAVATPTGVAESTLCGITSGASFGGKTAGSYPARVGIS